MIIINLIRADRHLDPYIGMIDNDEMKLTRIMISMMIIQDIIIFEEFCGCPRVCLVICINLNQVKIDTLACMNIIRIH